MIRVAVSGAGGKLASPIASAVADADDLTLSSLYNPNRVGHEFEDVLVVGSFAEVDADVIIETAHPDVVFENLAAWREAELATVVGTSGFTPERLEQLRDLWGAAGPPCLVVPNFSIGAVLMMRFAAEAASHFEAMEIIERHHSTKPDAPLRYCTGNCDGVRCGRGVICRRVGGTCRGLQRRISRRHQGALAAASRFDLPTGGRVVQYWGDPVYRASVHLL